MERSDGGSAHEPRAARKLGVRSVGVTRYHKVGGGSQGDGGAPAIEALDTWRVAPGTDVIYRIPAAGPVQVLVQRVYPTPAARSVKRGEAIAALTGED